MADIFISYARADKARVERLVAALQANGWTVWWDAEVLSWVTGAYLPLDENFDDSIALIDRSLAPNPGSSLAWLMSGWLRAAAGDAAALLRESLRLQPTVSINKALLAAC